MLYLFSHFEKIDGVEKLVERKAFPEDCIPLSILLNRVPEVRGAESITINSSIKTIEVDVLGVEKVYPLDFSNSMIEMIVDNNRYTVEDVEEAYPKKSIWSRIKELFAQ